MQKQSSIPSLAELRDSRAKLDALLSDFDAAGVKTRKRYPTLLVAGATVSGAAWLADGPEWLKWIALPMMAGVVIVIEVVRQVQDARLKTNVAESLQAISDLEAMHKR